MSLSFCLYHQDDLQACSDQHQVIAGSATNPSYASTLTAPDGVSLMATLDMAQGSHMRLRVVLDTLLGQEHTTTQTMRDINKELLERDIDLEE